MKLRISLRLKCVPMNWPISMGKYFKGVDDLYNDEVTHI